MKLKQNSGFTLIEVLIASVILFTALALTAELYNSSSLSANKITEHARVSQASIVAVQAIKSDLRKLAEKRQLSEHSGDLTINGIYFQWQAIREKFGPRALELSDSEPPLNQFSLFNVNVIPQSKERTRPPFSFKVVTW